MSVGKFPNPEEGDSTMKEGGPKAGSERLQDLKNFTCVPNDLIDHPDLSPQAKIVWQILWSYCYGDDNRAWPGMDTVAEKLGTTKRTVRKYRKELEEHGLVETEMRGPGQSNLYYLYDPKSVQDEGPNQKGLSGLNQKGLSGEEYEVEEDEGTTSTLDSSESNGGGATGIERGNLMKAIRERINATSIVPSMKSAVINCWGQIIFQSNLGDKELRWVWENYRNSITEEAMEAPDPRTVYQYVHQHFNTSVLPAMREARLWKEDEAEHTVDEVDKLIEGVFG